MEDSIHRWKAAVSLRLADPRRQAFLRWRRRCAGVLRAWVVPSGRIAITAAAYDAVSSTLPRGCASVATPSIGDGPMPHPRRSGRPRPSEGHAQARYVPLNWFSEGTVERPAATTRQTLLTCLGRAVEELGFAASRGYEGGAGRSPKEVPHVESCTCYWVGGLLLATASTTGSSAMTIVPLSKSAISGPQQRPRPSEMA